MNKLTKLFLRATGLKANADRLEEALRSSEARAAKQTADQRDRAHAATIARLRKDIARSKQGR